MITFLKLGFKGNFGNQLFQIASTIGIADKNLLPFSFPVWQYSKFFEYQFPVLSLDDDFELIIEHKYSYYDWNLKNGKYNIEGWLQSEKYFDLSKTKEIFTFDIDFKNQLIQHHQELFANSTILISIRRGDFIRHPYYFQLSFKYYFLAIIKNFPDWKNRNLIFTSDDIQYCEYHFSFLKNAYFLKNLSGIEQLVLGSQCDDFVISNSTFSWWSAWLGEKENSKIIRPIKNFSDEFGVQNDDSDYFPSRWIPFDDSLYKIDNKYFVLRVKAALYILFLNIKFEILKFAQRIRYAKRKWFGVFGI
ncbi:alpha-1,2-fucosyltransferase [Flavobacterium sp.]|uniref:alpha-1,2-fucosyltransferase n=1 Tax=Flavobacterium sp. TaxID=239 RepID=UPI0038FC3183